MMQESEEIYLLTPSRFNPHDDVYAANEGSTLDWKGNIVERQHRSTVLLTDIEEDESMNISAVVSSAKTRMIDRVLNAANVSEEKVGRSYQPIPHAADEIHSRKSPRYLMTSHYMDVSQRGRNLGSSKRQLDQLTPQAAHTL
jgi:hypothetical protein